MAPLEDKRARDEKKPNYPISSVGNALRLLIALKEGRAIRLSDAATHLEVSTSTAHRLLAMLQSYGFVKQDTATRMYSLGPVFFDLSLSAPSKMGLREITRPILADLAEKLDETVHLAVLDQVWVRYVYSIEGTHQLRVADRTGQSFLAHQSAMGRAFLADMRKDELKNMIAALREHDPELNESVLDEQLAQIREVGYGLNFRVDDVASLAMTVQGANGETVAAINAAGPATRMSKQGQNKIARHMHVAAAQIEEALRQVD
ncbi:IclR family transcriptional regulator [Arthrobacter sp. TMS1-12-1]